MENPPIKKTNLFKMERKEKKVENISLLTGAMRRSDRIKELNKRIKERKAQKDAKENVAKHTIKKRRLKKKPQADEEARKMDFTTGGAGSLLDRPSTLDKPISQIMEKILDELQNKDADDLLFQISQENQGFTNCHFGKVFETLREKVRNGVYKTMSQFKRDIDEMLQKVLGSNMVDPLVRNKAAALQGMVGKILVESLKKYKPKPSELQPTSVGHPKSFGRNMTATSNASIKGFSYGTEPLGNSYPMLPSSTPSSHSRGVDLESSSNGKILTRIAQFVAIANRGSCSNGNWNPHSANREGNPSEANSLLASVPPSISTSASLSAVGTCKEYEKPLILQKSYLTISQQLPQLFYTNNNKNYFQELMQCKNYSGPLQSGAQTVPPRQSLDLNYPETKEQPMPSYWSLHKNNNNAADTRPNCYSTLGVYPPGSNSVQRLLQPSSLANNVHRHKSQAPLTLSSSVHDIDELLLSGQQCKLENDKLFDLFRSIGTPEFLEKAEKVLGSSSSSHNRPQHAAANHVIVSSTAPAPCVSLGFGHGKERRNGKEVCSSWDTAAKKAMYGMKQQQQQARQSFPVKILGLDGQGCSSNPPPRPAT